LSFISLPTVVYDDVSGKVVRRKTTLVGNLADVGPCLSRHLNKVLPDWVHLNSELGAVLGEEKWDLEVILFKYNTNFACGHA
jgi:hypothetical protein